MKLFVSVKGIASGFVWMGAERISQVAAVFIVNGLLARTVTIHEYANWQYVYSISGILMALTWFCGGEAVLPRLVGASKERADTVNSQAFFIRLFVSGCVSFFTICIALIQSDLIARSYLIGFSASVLLREPLMVGFVALQSQRKIDSAAKIIISGVFLRIVLLLLWVSIFPNPYFVWLPWVAENIYTGIVIFKTSKVSVSWKRFRSANDNRGFLVSGWLIWLSLLLSMLYLKFDKIILKELISNGRDYAIYAASSQINENLLSISSILIQILAPYYLYRASDIYDLKIRVVRSFVPMLLVLTSLSFLAFLCGNKIIFAIFGSKFDGANVYFENLSFILPLWGIDALINSAFFKLNKPHYVLLKWSIALLVMLILVFSIKTSDIISLQIFSIYSGVLVSLLVGVFIMRKLGK